MQMLQLARHPGAANTVIDTLRPEHFRRVLMNLRNEAVRRQLRRGTQNIGEGINLISRQLFRRRDEVRRICGRNAHFVPFNGRSDERSVGQEWVCTCRCGWWPCLKKKK